MELLIWKDWAAKSKPNCECPSEAHWFAAKVEAQMPMNLGSLSAGGRYLQLRAQRKCGLLDRRVKRRDWLRSKLGFLPFRAVSFSEQVVV